MSHAHAHGHGRGMHHTDGPSRSSMDSAETQGHGHSHVRLDHPGLFEPFAPPSRDDFDARAFTVGIGGPVGSGKTALVLALCRHLRGVKVTSTKTAVPTSSTSTEKNSTNYQEVRDRGAILQNIAVVTNDIFTQEDCEFLVRHNALPLDRLAAVETGGCPHAAIREDISANLSACERMTARHPGLQLILLESGGDNLAANFTRELADYIIYVIDVSGGDKVPRKGGPGVTQSDLLVVNKTDLAEAVGSDLKVMARDAGKMRRGGATVFAQVKHGVGVAEIAYHILKAAEQTGLLRKKE